MNIASLALASALALTLGCAQPALAQTQDQTGATNPSGSGLNKGATANETDRNPMTTGRGDNGDNDDQGAAANGSDNWNSRRQWSEHRPMMMGPMWRRRMMLMDGAGGAQFHFRRGKARIDIRCSVQEDTETCVRAAGQLLDQIAKLHEGTGGNDNTTGAAGPEEQPGATPGSGEDDTGAPGERM
jgi:hypothetical protein